MKKTKRGAIVGFPNVGKSTLFNRLLQEKKSLVHSLPGMTRDWVAAPCTIEDRKFTLVDTGGFFDFADDPFSSQVKQKAWEASQEADFLIFVLDGKRELLPAERELYLSLVKLNKPMLLVINKVDSPEDEKNLGDFFRLGNATLIPISAEHKRNLEVLIEHIHDLIPEQAEGPEETQALKIALVGRINVGKSSIINLLSGQDKLIVSEIPGTTRDSSDTMIVRNKKAFCLVDTAGIRKLSRTQDQREKAGIIKAKKNIARADVICLVLDAEKFPTRQDTAIAYLALDSGKPLILALNKWDIVEKESGISHEYKARVFDKLEFVAYAPLLFISALSGKRVVKILDLAEEVYTCASKKVPTAKLNEFLAWLNKHHPPVSKKKGKIKIKYMTQLKTSPPTFLLFTHSRTSLAPAYEKFFINLLREKLDIYGTPIRLLLRRN